MSSVSSVAQTLFPAQSIFSEVQAIHDTGVYFREPEDSAAYNTAVSCKQAWMRELFGYEFGWGCLAQPYKYM